MENDSTLTVRWEIAPYRGDQLLFRLAQARCAAAEKRAQQHQEGRDPERRMREFDCVVETIVLVQAALEAHINLLFIDADEAPPRGWINRWKSIGRATRDKVDIDMCRHDVDLLEEVSAWRNLLLHGDKLSRERLRNRLKSAHPDLEHNHETDLLTADYARSVVTRAESLFRWAAEHTGVQAPFTTAAWVAPDEVC